MDELLPIGRFSRLCWLSIKALRVYDDMGLLRPAHVDPDTGYRYYRPDQATTARIIATLRSLDMPLATIRQVLAESDPDRVRDLLDAHRLVLERRVDRDRHLLQRVETFIRMGAVMTYEISTRETAAAEVLGTTYPAPMDSLGETSRVAYHRLYDAIAAAGGRPDGSPRLVYLDLADDTWTVEACVPVAGLTRAPDGFSLHRARGGLAAVTLHVGPYEELGIAYREVESWIDAQGLRSAGAPYDVYVNDPAEVNDPSKFETEIVWPVSRD
ncbi:MerR family transcriptional regulator [Jiangella anatolica]|uniref:MerR family transcriptional regulator n=1 Tax=Jiangella anatolica TaxID=2670374 RepID=A0A2W2C0F4_9ACTN|nr:MerR family transcriptional regulator [Jiangella anatolica]PZF81427.1 MerR family transcriptional regulator [Jiangella anatolica]